MKYTNILYNLPVTSSLLGRNTLTTFSSSNLRVVFQGHYNNGLITFSQTTLRQELDILYNVNFSCSPTVNYFLAIIDSVDST